MADAVYRFLGLADSLAVKQSNCLASRLTGLLLDRTSASLLACKPNIKHPLSTFTNYIIGTI